MAKETFTKHVDSVLSAAAAVAGDAVKLTKIGVEKAGHAAEDAVSYTKTRMNLATLNRELQQKLQKVGELSYAAYKGASAEHDAVDHLFHEIDALKGEISALEVELYNIRGKKPCTNCGCDNRLGDLFCSSCGQPLVTTYSSRKQETPIDVEPHELYEDSRLEEDDQ